ncbi:MAG: methyltransferase domain-containing protein [Chitinophagaceae bacterium]
MTKINLGCGAVRPKGWVNTDSSLNANIQKIPLIGKVITRNFSNVVYNDSNVVYMNLNRSWKHANDSIDVVYGSHVFEHLSSKAADLLLKESYRCLKPGGVIRLAVPDLYKICKKYIADFENGQENAYEFIMWAINMHREGQYGPDINMAKKVVYEWQGYPHQHKFMYDERSLGTKLKNAGFTDILSLEYGVSNYIPEITDVEGYREIYLSVYLEGKKPIPA